MSVSRAETSAERAYRELSCRVPVPIWLALAFGSPSIVFLLPLILTLAHLSSGFLDRDIDTSGTIANGFDNVVAPAAFAVLIIVHYRVVIRMLRGDSTVLALVVVAAAAAVIPFAFNVGVYSALMHRLPTGVYWVDPPLGYLLNAYRPLEEEFVLQGALQTTLQRFGPIAAVVLTSIPFAAAHIVNIGTFVAPPGLSPAVYAIVGVAAPVLRYAIVR